MPLERGYWLVDGAAWPSAARRRVWRFLANFLRRGLAGWAVWARRDPGPRPFRIRLYAWACLAEHTYLLLYLASRR